MNRSLPLCVLALLTALAAAARAQAADQNAAAPPEGYDVRREGIEHGKLDLVEYDSKTVGAKRKAQVYTPPGYAAGGSWVTSPRRRRRGRPSGRRSPGRS